MNNYPQPRRDVAPAQTWTPGDSPLHNRIERTIKELEFTSAEAQLFRDNVWHYVNYNRWSFDTACAIAINDIIGNPSINNKPQ